MDITANSPLLVPDKLVEDPKGKMVLEDSKEDDHPFMMEDNWEEEDPEDILWFSQKMKELEDRNIPDRDMISSTNPALPDIKEDRRFLSCLALPSPDPARVGWVTRQDQQHLLTIGAILVIIKKMQPLKCGQVPLQ